MVLVQKIDLEANEVIVKDLQTKSVKTLDISEIRATDSSQNKVNQIPTVGIEF